MPECCRFSEIHSVGLAFFQKVSGILMSKPKVTVEEVSHWADLTVDFVLIGLDGCGTTSLRHGLQKHPVPQRRLEK